TSPSVFSTLSLLDALPIFCHDELASMHRVAGGLRSSDRYPATSFHHGPHAAIPAWDSREYGPSAARRPHLLGSLPSSPRRRGRRSEEHTSELQSRGHLVCR